MHFTKAKGHEQSDQRVSIRALVHIQYRSLMVKTTIMLASQSPQLLWRQYSISSLTGIVTVITDWIGIVNSHLLNRCKKDLLSFDEAGTKKEVHATLKSKKSWLRLHYWETTIWALRINVRNDQALGTRKRTSINFKHFLWINSFLLVTLTTK